MDKNLIAYVGVVGTICSIIFGYIGYRKGLQKESTESGKSSGALMSDIGYIKAGIDDLKRKQESAETRHYALAERVTKVEESSKQAHKRIDRLENIERE
jgi:peptidoglycan hydrolase CwlO-like protein